MLSQLARRVSVAEVEYAPRRRMPPHAHPMPSIGLVLRGSVEEELGGRTCQSRSLSVVVKPAGLVHEDRFGAGGARMLSLALPRRTQSRIAARGWFHGGAVARLALAVLCGVHDGRAERTRAIERLLEVLGESRREDDPPPWLLAARSSIIDGASVAAAATDVGVHPGSLSRAYRRSFGVTPLEDRARRRVLDVADRLTATGASLAAVATETGFADQAHLTRVFKRETGLTPAVFRSLAGA